MDISINHLTRSDKRILLYWILGLCLILAGCQSTPQKETNQFATMPPIQNEPKTSTNTPSATIMSSITTTPNPPIRESETPITDEKAATPFPEMETIVPSATPFSGDGFLLYGATINDEEQIYVLQPGGTSHFVTTGKMLRGHAISPEGTKIIIDTNNLSQYPKLPDNVFIFDLETEQILPINLQAYPGSGFWSQDGTSFLYIARYEDETPDQLIIYDFISGENRVLIEMENILDTAGWSVDGETIAFVSKVDGQYDLFTINSETLKQEQLTDDLEIETITLWSPKTTQMLIGSIIDERSVFESWPSGAENLYLFDIANNEWQLLVEKWLSSESVSWSPDNKKIAFWDEGLLCIKNLETMTDICPLINVSPFDEYIVSPDTLPVWSADGNWIAFYAIKLPCMVIYFLDLETNSVIPGDLGCDVTEISTSFPIYWSPTNLPEFSN